MNKSSRLYFYGFNLYFGIKALKKKSLLVGLKKLSLNLLQPTQTLVSVKYFTSRISSPTDKAQRQKSFIEATETLSDVQIYYGQYISTIKTCRNCEIHIIIIVKKNACKFGNPNVDRRI